MKKRITLLGVLFLAIGLINAQHRETMALESFDYVQLDGNIRLFIDQGNREILTVQARKSRFLDDYRIRVRNNTLYVSLRDNVRSAPKIKLYLEHPGLKGIDADGLVHINSEDTITGDDFTIKGDGFIRGEVKVDVRRLKVDLDGFCFMGLSGKADICDFDLDGFGRINAGELLSTEVSKSADGLAGIKTGR